MSELNLQLGEWYRQRNGKIAGPLSHSGGNDYPFEDEFESWTLSGVYSIGEQSESDLIAHIPRTDPRHPEYATAQPQPATVSFLIDVPVPPEGWQVAGYRVPVVGEMRFMYGGWRPVNNPCDFRWPVAVAVRCVPPWTPPSSLATGWVTVDDDGKPYWSESTEKPVWWSSIGTWGRNPGYMHRINPKMFRDFTPPPIRGEHAIWEIK
jgi:hypothetical protein